MIGRLGEVVIDCHDPTPRRAPAAVARTGLRTTR